MGSTGRIGRAADWKDNLLSPAFDCIPKEFRFDYEAIFIGRSIALHADCFEWLSRLPENCLHAVVTDPPYGVKEYDVDQIQKRANGNGGIWRIPPSFDGSTRSPLPRFTALDQTERRRLYELFAQWGKLVSRALLPGAHVFIATNAFIAELLYEALVAGGLEFRGQVIRLVRTLRGGDRPKNAEEEFPGVSSMPRGCYEPWGIFRKSLPPKWTVGECLRRFATGGLRRTLHDKPFSDVIASERTPKKERALANHPSLKPQAFLRQIVHAVLPLGKGIVVDPFMGAGSTVAACEALGIASIGVERHGDFFKTSAKAIPKLAAIATKDNQQLLF
jgi:site-specific DNA-methyltransferase (adenine-specific)